MIMISMRNVSVLHIKKVANELSGPFAKVGALQADNDSSNPSETFYKNIFLTKRFDLSLFYQYTQDGKTYKKHVWFSLTRSVVLGSSHSPPF